MDDHLAYNEAIREELHHEHSVMNHRTGWHHVIQIAMFTAFYKLAEKTYPDPLFLIKLFLPIIGIVFAKSGLYSIWVTEKARACILMHWNRYRDTYKMRWEDYPPVTGDPFSHIKDSIEDPVKRKDMRLTNRDMKIAQKVPHRFMLYNFIPYVFIVLWTFCFLNVILTIVLTQKI
jgi:hypothetical protein